MQMKMKTMKMIDGTTLFEFYELLISYITIRIEAVRKRRNLMKTEKRRPIKGL